jgi:hypothetical protein
VGVGQGTHFLLFGPTVDVHRERRLAWESLNFPLSESFGLTAVWPSGRRTLAHVRLWPGQADGVAVCVCVWRGVALGKRADI